MKKLMAVLMSVLIGVSMTGCSDLGGGSSSVTEAGNDFVNETIMPNIIDGDEVIDERYFYMDTTIEETVIYDANDIKITAKRLDFSSWKAWADILIENNSDEKRYFSSGTYGDEYNSVNGYMTDGGILMLEIEPGKSEEVSAVFSYNKLILLGIHEIADITLDIRIRGDKLGGVSTGPLQIKTSAYDSYDYSDDVYVKMISDNNRLKTLDYSVNYFSEDKLYDKDGISLISEAIVKDEEDDDDNILFLEFKNDSEKLVFTEVSIVSVNGLVLEGQISPDKYAVSPGKICAAQLVFSDHMDINIRNAYGIKEIDSITFNLRILDEDKEEINAADDISVTASDTDKGFDNSGDEIYNKNDFRIISQKAVDDSSKYFYEMYLCLLAENSGTDDIVISGVIDSFSLNGYKVNFRMRYSNSVTVPAGKTAVVILILDEGPQIQANISAVEDIKEYGITFEIRNKQTKETEEAAVSAKFDR